jgi:hypothetical protein
MKIPKYVLPCLVVVALFGGYALRTVFTHPTTSIALAGGGGKTLTCIVDGVKCKGTATFFSRLYEATPGIQNIETYATEHRVIFTYDPAVISPDGIRGIMEAPVPLRDGSSRQIFVCRSMN